MPYNAGDKVRFGSCKEFGVVQGKAPDNTRYRVKLTLIPQEVLAEEARLVPDYALTVGDYCYVKGMKKIYRKIAARQNVPAPKEEESSYRYTVQDSDGGNPRAVNGNLITEVTTIAEPQSKQDFFSAVNNQMPLILMPQDLRDSGFVLAFRGDDRGTEEIFQIGFKPRQEYVSVMYRGSEADLLSASGVCASLKPEAAGLFPLFEKGKTPQENTCIYVFIAYQHFETFRVQAKQAQNTSRELQTKIEELMKGEEIALGREGAPPQTILGAYKVKRKWLGEDWKAGCTYSVGEYIENTESFYYCAPDADRWETDVEQYRKNIVDRRVRQMTQSPVFNLPG